VRAKALAEAELYERKRERRGRDKYWFSPGNALGRFAVLTVNECGKGKVITLGFGLSADEPNVVNPLKANIVDYVCGPTIAESRFLSGEETSRRAREFLSSPNKVNGFTSIVSASGAVDKYYSYRDRERVRKIWYEYGGTAHSATKQEIVWKTDPVHEIGIGDIVFVWACGMAKSTESPHQLYLNNKKVIAFAACYEDRLWENTDAALYYDFKVQIGPDSFGVMYLKVPREQYLREAGAQTLRVVGSGEGGESWYGISDFTDTIGYEGASQGERRGHIE